MNCGVRLAACLMGNYVETNVRDLSRLPLSLCRRKLVKFMMFATGSEREFSSESHMDIRTLGSASLVVWYGSASDWDGVDWGRHVNGFQDGAKLLLREG